MAIIKAVCRSPWIALLGLARISNGLLNVAWYSFEQNQKAFDPRFTPENLLLLEAFFSFVTPVNLSLEQIIKLAINCTCFL